MISHQGRGSTELVLGNAGELVGGGVANAVAAGLDGVHLHGCQFAKDIRYVFQLRPVELNVGPGADVGIALVVLASDVGQLADLSRRQQPIGHSNTQHRRIALDVQTVLQAKRQQFCVSQFTGEIAANLVTELTHAILDDVLVILVVYVHKCPVFSGCLQLLRARPRTR
jgi:hypothetical protein